MKGLLSATVASAVTGAFALPSPLEKESIAARQSAPCSSAVTLSGNPFSNRTLYPNNYYGAKVKAAVANISDSTLAAKAAKVANIGTFLWM